MAGRTYKTEAVVLRSLRFGEADRVLHLYTLDRGRVGALAKGIRRTTSRFGGRPRAGPGGELIRAPRAAREEPYRLSVGFIGLEAMLRLFPEQEANARAFEALTRFLDLLDQAEPLAGERPATDSLVLSFQLKLLWLSGYLPHLTSCAECGAHQGLVGYSPSAGGAVCASCRADATSLSPAGLHGIEALLRHPLAEAAGLGLGRRASREALAVISSSYEYHGGFRL